MIRPHRTSGYEPALRQRSFARVIAGFLRSFFVLAATIYVGGFLVYIAEFQRAAEPAFDKADAIVALTGGPDRIAEAVHLLADKRAGRLLISGVNEQTDEDDLIKTVPALQKFITCCVTIDREAMNTHDNAVQTLAWAKQNNINSIILVTAHAHMPRALFEFRAAFGNNFMISPWRVGGPQRAEEWWRDMPTVRAMLVEYTKLSGAILRYFFFKFKTDLGDAIRHG